MSAQLEKFLRTYWWLVLAVISAAIAWGVNTAQLAVTVQGVNLLTTNVQSANTKIDSVQTDVASIKATLPYVDRSLTDLQSRVRALEARR